MEPIPLHHLTSDRRESLDTRFLDKNGTAILVGDGVNLDLISDKEKLFFIEYAGRDSFTLVDYSKGVRTPKFPLNSDIAAHCEVVTNLECLFGTQLEP